MHPSERKALGNRAEQLVADWLVGKGVQIVARNLRLGPLELDIVARTGELVLVVEVRTRSPSSWTTGLSSITPTKKARLRRAGQRLWDRRYRSDPSVQRMRFDVAVVDLSRTPPLIEYVEAAF